MLQWISDFSKYATENALQTGLMIGALVTVIGSYAVGYRQDRQKDEFQKRVYSNQEQTIDQLKKTLTEQRNLILGGDSYLYFQLFQIGSTHNFMLKYNFVGLYPLYDARLDINEYDIVLTQSGTMASTNLRTYKIDLQTVHSIINAKSFQKFSLNPNIEIIGKRYFILGTARNGITEQDIIVYINRSGGTEQAVKVTTTAPSYSRDFGDFPYGGTRRRVKKLTDGFDQSLLQNNTEGDTGWKHNDFERNN